MKAAQGMGLTAFGGALLLHAGLLSVLFAAEAPRREPPRKPPVRLRVAPRPEIPKPAPAPAPEPDPQPIAVVTPRPEPPRPREEKPKKKPPEPSPQPKLTPPPAAEPVAPPPEVSPAPVASDAPPEPPRPVRKFTVALDATVASGGVAVPVSSGGSGFAFGAPDGDPNAEPRLPARTTSDDERRGVNAAVPARAFDVAELTRAPRPLSQPPPERLRALYPEAARKANLEGNVSLRLLISAQGQVVEARLARGAGNGFDEVALRLAREIRFAPGERGGRPVEVWIPWTFRFRLDG
ncbi:MAG: energy transducer TonB [Myxococcales bacterium]|nr:energy transducer TonB [Myxococcales bacterium]